MRYQPRHPKGTTTGGQFAPTPTASQISTDKPLKLEPTADETTPTASKVVLRIPGKQRTIKKVDGVWLNPSVFGYAFSRKIQNEPLIDTKEAVIEHLSQVCVDMFNAGDADPSDPQHLHHIMLACRQMAAGLGCGGAWTNVTLRAVDVGSKRLHPIRAMAQIRLLNLLYPNITQTEIAASILPSYNMEIDRSPDVYMGTTVLNAGYYKGEDGKILHRYVAMPLAFGGDTIFDTKHHTDYDTIDKQVLSNIRRLEIRHAHSGLMAAVVASETSPDDPLHEKAIEHLDRFPTNLAGMYILDPIFKKVLRQDYGMFRQNHHDGNPHVSTNHYSLQMRKLLLEFANKDTRKSNLAAALSAWMDHGSSHELHDFDLYLLETEDRSAV